jgi:nucleotide-binding universal stress UspA family protein
MRGDRTKDDEVKKRAEEQGGTLVESVAEQFEGIETRPVVEWGEPYESVLDYADEHDIDIIVMGTHGRTGLDHHLLGSVTEKVVRTSDVPVLTVRASGEK